MLRFLAFTLALFLLCDDAQAQSNEADPATQTASQTPIERRANDVLAILNGDEGVQDMFAPEFLAQIPFKQIEQISTQFTDQFGPALEVVDLSTPTGLASRVTIRMERAVGNLVLSIEDGGEHRINGLRLLEFTPTGDTFEKVAADLEALDGNVSAYFGPLDTQSAVFAINPADQMPLGSAMKLYVLGALSEQIAQGERSWGDVIALNTKSFPSGQMQNWPEGSPVTLHTLASLMISISDNTATDQLITLLGRDAIEEYMQHTGHSAPELNTPWITTRELFLIKGGSLETLEAYSNGSTKARATILAKIEEDPATVDQINARLAAGPVAIDKVEWFASASDLAGLFQSMKADGDPEALRIMAINPALPQSFAEAWSYIGFKGGSETGVLNMTWLVTGKDGDDRMLTLSWANPAKAVETQTLLLIAQRILALAK